MQEHGGVLTTIEAESYPAGPAGAGKRGSNMEYEVLALKCPSDFNNNSIDVLGYLYCHGACPAPNPPIQVQRPVHYADGPLHPRFKPVFLAFIEPVQHFHGTW